MQLPRADAGKKKKKVKMTWSRLDYDTNKKASPVTLAL